MRLNDERPAMTFDQFMAHFMASIARGEHRANGQRYGQWLFNELSFFNAALAERLRGTPRDPFYRETADDLDPSLYWWMSNNWYREAA